MCCVLAIRSTRDLSTWGKLYVESHHVLNFHLSTPHLSTVLKPRSDTMADILKYIHRKEEDQAGIHLIYLFFFFF